VKFRCERDVLVDALTTVGRAVASRGGALPVLSGIRLEVSGDRLSLTGTDLDLTIQSTVTVAGSADGVVVAPGRLITDIVRALEPGAVTLEADEEELGITAGRSQFSLHTHLARDFPTVLTSDGEAVKLPVVGLVEALRQVVRAASNEDSRPILTGVLMASESEGLRLVATDSYRLAVRDLKGPGVLGDNQRVLVPSRALAELQRLVGSLSGGSGPETGEAPVVSLRLGGHHATFEMASVRLTTRLIEGEFPNYRNLIPSNYPNRAVISRETLLDALRRVKLLVRDATTPVRLALKSDGIDLTVITQDWGQASESIDAKYEGAEMTVAFNPAYLIDGVEAITSDEIQLDTVDSLKPATLRPTDNSDYLYLLMPVRVS
jgi:DNA polymerase-3 subunit beta